LSFGDGPSLGGFARRRRRGLEVRALHASGRGNGRGRRCRVLPTTAEAGEETGKKTQGAEVFQHEI